MSPLRCPAVAGDTGRVARTRCPRTRVRDGRRSSAERRLVWSSVLRLAGSAEGHLQSEPLPGGLSSAEDAAVAGRSPGAGGGGRRRVAERPLCGAAERVSGSAQPQCRRVRDAGAHLGRRVESFGAATTPWPGVLSPSVCPHRRTVLPPPAGRAVQTQQQAAVTSLGSPATLTSERKVQGAQVDGERGWDGDAGRAATRPACVYSVRSSALAPGGASYASTTGGTPLGWVCTERTRYGPG